MTQTWLKQKTLSLNSKAILSREASKTGLTSSTLLTRLPQTPRKTANSFYQVCFCILLISVRLLNLSQLLKTGLIDFMKSSSTKETRRLNFTFRSPSSAIEAKPILPLHNSASFQTSWCQPSLFSLTLLPTSARFKWPKELKTWWNGKKFKTADQRVHPIPPLTSNQRATEAEARRIRRSPKAKPSSER